MVRSSLPFRSVGVALLVAGCALPKHKSQPVPSDNIVITADDIARMNVNTVLDVLRRRVPQFNFRTDRNGQHLRATRHGASSIYLNDNPMLIVDGARMTDLDALSQIPATQVDRITVMTGITGTTYYGTDATGGVIVLETRNGSD